MRPSRREYRRSVTQAQNAGIERSAEVTERTPPSHNSSKGGVGGGMSTEETHPPPSHVSSEGGVEGVC
jgi:hypothetical protein